MKKLNNSGWEIKLSDDNCGLIYSLYLGIFESSAGNISEMTEKIFFQLTEKTKNFSLNKQKNIDELIFYISINNGTEFDNFNSIVGGCKKFKNFDSGDLDISEEIVTLENKFFKVTIKYKKDNKNIKIIDLGKFENSCEEFTEITRDIKSQFIACMAQKEIPTTQHLIRFLFPCPPDTCNEIKIIETIIECALLSFIELFPSRITNVYRLKNQTFAVELLSIEENPYFSNLLGSFTPMMRSVNFMKIPTDTISQTSTEQKIVYFESEKKCESGVKSILVENQSSNSIQSVLFAKESNEKNKDCSDLLTPSKKISSTNATKRQRECESIKKSDQEIISSKKPRITESELAQLPNNSTELTLSTKRSDDLFEYKGECLTKTGEKYLSLGKIYKKEDYSGYFLKFYPCYNLKFIQFVIMDDGSYDNEDLIIKTWTHVYGKITEFPTIIKIEDYFYVKFVIIPFDRRSRIARLGLYVDNCRKKGGDNQYKRTKSMIIKRLHENKDLKEDKKITIIQLIVKMVTTDTDEIVSYILDELFEKFNQNSRNKIDVMHRYPYIIITIPVDIINDYFKKY